MLFEITERPLALKPVFEPLAHEGAVLTFTGCVRSTNPQHGLTEVAGIEYQCYRELAQTEGLRILESVRKLHGISRIYCVHRVGFVEVGEASIYIELTSTHRADAFAAVASIMDKIKTTLPVWKKELLGNGEGLWT